jgi:hypothetical protein
MPAALRVLLALVLNNIDSFPPHVLGEENTREAQDNPTENDHFGTYIKKKKENVLRVGFQGGYHYTKKTQG